MFRSLSAAVLLLLATAAASVAQGVEGRVFAAGGASTPSGATVVLLDASGAVVAGTLTDDAGRFRLAAPGPGVYRLRVDRIGFRSTTSPLITLATDRTIHRDLHATEEAIQLEGIVAQADQQCRARPDAGEASATVWEEARKALAAAEVTRREKRLRFEIELYERALDLPERRVRSDERRRVVAVASYGFASIPAERLNAQGFVYADGEDVTYHAPDAAVLLSDAFLDTHCFRIARRGPAGEIGLAFEPKSRHHRVGITGALWLDRSTNFLRRIEFGYAGPRPEVEEPEIGGRVEFEALPTGEWMVRRWYVRMPLDVARSAGRTWTDLMPGTRKVRRSRLLAVQESGGEVMSVVPEGRPALFTNHRASVEGIVHDSVSGAPLPGALVYLNGTGLRAEADSLGRFRIAGVPPGRYSLSFVHPRLGMPLAPSPAASLEVGSGDVRGLRLSAPPLGRILDAQCTPAERLRGSGILAGRVLDRASRRAIPGAPVSIEWVDVRMREGSVSGTREDLQLRADDQGYYVACGLPAGHEVSVRFAAEPDVPRTTVYVRLRSGAPTLHDLHVRKAADQ